ncbi:MAG: tetratricopeptide repeat protein [Candidatus Cloacimonetes bacterium]|nr:tetratricopeptide repeat protein [Candidatus Cloacimonadota bacterium]
MRTFALLFIVTVLLAGCSSPKQMIENGQWYEANNYPDKAEEYYEKALDKEPENAQLHYLLGRNKNRETNMLLIQRTQYCALSSVDNSEVTVDRDSLLAIDNRIQACHQEAIGHFLKALEFNPKLFDAHYPLAISYLETGQYDMALYYFEQITRREPDNVQAIIFLGQCHEAKGDRSKANGYYQQGVNMGSTRAQELLNG